MSAAEPAGGEVVKLVTPRLTPARFAEYLVVLPPGRGTSDPVAPGFETFLYGLEGDTVVEALGVRTALGPGAFTYLPHDTGFALHGDPSRTSRLLWLKRRYEAFPGVGAPELVAGHRDDEPFERTAAPGLRRRELLDPDDPRRDFTMSLLAFDPGAGLDTIEIHDEEHGLYMTAGAGEYLLDRERHEVRQGDFIYMAPYCPQGFVAGDHAAAEYLLYKDVYRDGFRAPRLSPAARADHRAAPSPPCEPPAPALNTTSSTRTSATHSSRARLKIAPSVASADELWAST
jgi:(S)-ureidoglycine aminohydrolase